MSLVIPGHSASGQERITKKKEIPEDVLNGSLWIGDRRRNREKAEAEVAVERPSVVHGSGETKRVPRISRMRSVDKQDAFHACIITKDELYCNGSIMDTSVCCVGEQTLRAKSEMKMIWKQNI